MRPQSGGVAGDCGKLAQVPILASVNRRRGEGEGDSRTGGGGGGGRHSERARGRETVFLSLGASQHYSTNRSDREFYLSPRPICAVTLKFSLRKVFWIISAAILIQLLHHRVGANGSGSLSGVQSPSSSYLKRVHPEYTCCNRDIPRGGERRLSKSQKLCKLLNVLFLLFVPPLFFYLSLRLICFWVVLHFKPLKRHRQGPKKQSSRLPAEWLEGDKIKRPERSLVLSSGCR